MKISPDYDQMSGSRSISTVLCSTKYFKMRVKKLNYCGEPAVALFMLDRTEKVREKIYILHEEEE